GESEAAGAQDLANVLHRLAGLGGEAALDQRHRAWLVADCARKVEEVAGAHRRRERQAERLRGRQRDGFHCRFPESVSCLISGGFAQARRRSRSTASPLSSGMAVTVELKTGARRVFEYTCSPAGRSRLADDAGEVIPSPAKGRRTTPVSRRVMREKAAKRQTRAWRPRRDGGEGRGPVVRVRAPCKGRHSGSLA